MLKPPMCSQKRETLLRSMIIFDALGATEKELLWIEESNQRFYAYNHFGQHPARLIGWFDRHMGATSDAAERSARIASA